MLRTTLTIAWRSLLRRKGTTMLNVAGLALGLGGALLIGLWIQHERAFDRSHEQSDRIHRVVVNYTTDGFVREQMAAQGLRLRKGLVVQSAIPIALLHQGRLVQRS